MKDSGEESNTLTPAGREVWASKEGQSVLSAALNNKPQDEPSLKRVREQLKSLDVPQDAAAPGAEGRDRLAGDSGEAPEPGADCAGRDLETEHFEDGSAILVSDKGILLVEAQAPYEQASPLTFPEPESRRTE